MEPRKTTARPSVDLDATDEFPVLDAAAYQADVLSREPDEPSAGGVTASESEPSTTASPAADDRASNDAVRVADSDDMLAVEHWIAQKAEELRAHHDALSLAQRERAAARVRAGELSRELAELEVRLRDSEARERSAQRTLGAQNQSHAELTHRVRDEASARERLARQVEALQDQLASCLESLHSRESYRAIYESTLQALDVDLAAARLQTSEQEARAHQLGVELQSCERRLQDAVRERDEARHLHETEAIRHTAEQNDGERKRNALESRLAELTAEHADARAQNLANEAALTAAKRRAEAEALASGSAAQREHELESAVASRQAELGGARLEIERNRALLGDLTAALLKSQTMFSNQGRLLEERAAAASTLATSHAEQVALVSALRGRIEELTARLAAPEGERHALEERVAALTQEAAASESRISHLVSTNSELRATVGQLDTLLVERDAELTRATQLASVNAHALGRVQSSIDELGRTLTAAGGASQAQVSILTRIDNGQNHSVVLRGRTTIGRDHDNDLALAMRSVSRHHAALIPGYRAAFVQDLGSTNGVLVNQRRVRCARLEHGDVITLGGAQFRYTVTATPVGASSPVPAASRSARASLKRPP